VCAFGRHTTLPRRLMLRGAACGGSVGDGRHMWSSRWRPGCWLNTWRRQDAERTVEVVWQACRSVSGRWRPRTCPSTVGRCLTPQVLLVRRRCPATRGCVTCVTTEHYAWVPGVIPDEAKRQPSLCEDGSAVSCAQWSM
jgi:hypothetical protein